MVGRSDELKAPEILLDSLRVETPTMLIVSGPGE
jgi:hypothetical protein